MKKKIAIIGSTGSIGVSTASIIKKNIKNFNVCLLSTNKNISILKNQIKIFKPRYIVINDYKQYLKFIKSNKNKKIKIFNNFKFIRKKSITKLDYTISAISGFEGLEPTLEIIPFTKIIAIANKESLICGWNLIEKKLKRFKTTFIPVDSEHFSIWSLVKNTNEDVKKIYITASGGPFLKKSIKQLANVKPKEAMKHPTWNMGKKISVDSATLINKIFEILEAKKIFNLNLKDIDILLHPSSYIHAIVEFKNGTSKILAHETDMKIPIFNSIFFNQKKEYKTKPINIKKLNSLNLHIADKKKFTSLNLIKNFNNIEDSFYETVLVSANDELVNLFLQNKISFLDITRKLRMIMNLKEFKKMKERKPKNYQQISTLNKYVRLKTRSLCVRSARYV